MTHTLIIAECGSSWQFSSDPLANAYKLIEAAKACGADVAKFQWTSDAAAMAERRNVDASAMQMYRQYLQYDSSWLHRLKESCDKVGIEFACTVYLPRDIEVVTPLVKRFKVSAFESQWVEFVSAHFQHHKQVIISNGQMHFTKYSGFLKNPCEIKLLHCVSKYPASVDDLQLKLLWPDELGSEDGLSDHTTSTLTGALAVAAGATIVEKHIRLRDTPTDNPDYPHSLIAMDPDEAHWDTNDYGFREYVQNIREAERCM